MELKLRGNLRLELKIIRILPIVQSIIQFLMIIFLFLGITVFELSLIGSISLIPLLFYYISSKIFGFCYYHRISIHYLFLTQLMCVIDQYIGFPINTFFLFIIHIILFLWLIIFLIYFKFVKLR